MVMAAMALAISLVQIPSSTQGVLDGHTGVKLRVSVAPFLIGTHEVTQAEFQQVMGFNPSERRGATHPVENVSWWEAIRYTNLLSIREKLRPCYELTTGRYEASCDGYRLPTNAEWNAAVDERLFQDRAAIRRYGHLGLDGTRNLTHLREQAGQGTRPVGSLQPNRYGVYDLLGNVWEWCYDFQDPDPEASGEVVNPAGPLRGIERVIRGGSYVTSVSKWNPTFRSSFAAEHKSPYTGFRVARNVAQKEPAAVEAATWFEPYNRIPDAVRDQKGTLAPLPAGSRQQWNEGRHRLRKEWMEFLGSPTCPRVPPVTRPVETVEDRYYTGYLQYLQVEPDHEEKIYVMVPRTQAGKPMPAVIVPYYDVDTPAGTSLGGRKLIPPGTSSFGYLLVRQGYVVIAVRWFAMSYGESYDESMANLRRKYPNCTGLGKWVWDLHQVLDYVYTRPDIDRKRIGVIGHSLAGKLALYSAAMDDRITVAVSSEGGIGFPFSNYEDYWYLGEEKMAQAGRRDQHELIAMVAPRPFLLIGGDKYDSDKSWAYINSAREIYRLFDRPLSIGYFNHRTGHKPTPESVERALEWFRKFFSE